MKQKVISRETLRALPAKEAVKAFQRINTNPNNSYKSGFEFYMNYIPIIHGKDDPKKAEKLEYIADIISDLAERLMQESWILENWPSPEKMLNRVVLGIDEVTGGELIMVRWNAIETPIHGHQYGQMIDYLVKGMAEEIEYQIIDEKLRTVEQIGSAEFKSMQVLSNDFHAADTVVSRGALIHKFIPLKKCITLHYIPEHPRDGRGNLFNEPK